MSFRDVKVDVGTNQPFGGYESSQAFREEEESRKIRTSSSGDVGEDEDNDPGLHPLV